MKTDKRGIENDDIGHLRLKKQRNVSKSVSKY